MEPQGAGAWSLVESRRCGQKPGAPQVSQPPSGHTEEWDTTHFSQIHLMFTDISQTTISNFLEISKQFLRIPSNFHKTSLIVLETSKKSF